MKSKGEAIKIRCRSNNRQNYSNNTPREPRLNITNKYGDSPKYSQPEDAYQQNKMRKNISIGNIV